jgi:hypothetical protein
VTLYRIDTKTGEQMYPRMHLCYPSQRTSPSYTLTAMTQYNRDWRGDCGSLHTWIAYYLMIGAEQPYVYDMYWKDMAGMSTYSSSSGASTSTRSAAECVGGMTGAGGGGLVQMVQLVQG